MVYVHLFKSFQIREQQLRIGVEIKSICGTISKNGGNWDENYIRIFIVTVYKFHSTLSFKFIMWRAVAKRTSHVP